MEPFDLLSTSPLTVGGPLIRPAQPASNGALSDAQLMARLLASYPSQVFEGWSPPPPSPEAAANADGLMRVGLAQLYPQLFGDLQFSDLNDGGYPGPPDPISAGAASGAAGTPRADYPPSSAGASEPDLVRPQSDPYAAVGLEPPSVLEQRLPATAFQQTYRAKPGDSISTIVGSSDPETIGKFAIQNGLRSGTIYPGREYAFPTLVRALTRVRPHSGKPSLIRTTRVSQTRRGSVPSPERVSGSTEPTIRPIA
jgi:hypothetical protein